MKYNKAINGWFVVNGEHEWMMHGREWLYLRTGDNEGIPCRIELGKHWYVIMGRVGVKLNLISKEL